MCNLLVALNNSTVALRKESVDRNSYYQDMFSLPPAVALRKESVDRNVLVSLCCVGFCLSLSARRAWIEMIEEISKYVVKESLSARRAWIEINMWCSVEKCLASLSARRAWIEI